MGNEKKSDDFFKEITDVYNQTVNPRNRESYTFASPRKGTIMMQNEAVCFNSCYA